MPNFNHSVLVPLSLLLLRYGAAQPLSSPPGATYDVVIFGGTATGVMAAIGAANASTTQPPLRIALLVVGTTPLGGMTSGGLADVDTGDRGICGGFSREFFFRVNQVYTGVRSFPRKGQECRVSLRIFEQMLAEVADEVTVVRGVAGLSVRHMAMDTRKIATLTVRDRSGKDLELAGKIFVDASYEGDLLRLSGASWTVGREPNTTYGEQHAGVQAWPKLPGSDAGQVFPPDLNYAVNPFVSGGETPGPLLPGVKGLTLAPPGSGDKKIMAYNFRVCLTNNASNMVPLPKPAGYNPSQFELLKRYLSIDPSHHGLSIQHCPGGHRQPGCGMFIWTGPGHIPGPDTGKLDLNTLGPISSNMIGASWAWPLANESERAAIFEAHKAWDQGLLYFLSTDPSVPAAMRNEVASFGLCKDEFLDSEHWPPQLYVRESVRLVNDFVLREGPAGAPLSVDRGVAPHNDSIGIGNWGIDVHQVQRLALKDPRPGGRWRTVDEGDLEVHAGSFEVPYRSIVPRKSEVTNLLVPTCIASSHLAYGAYRLESPYMVVGHSAGVAAALALENETGAAVQDISIAKLQAVLRAQGQVLTLAERKPVPGPPPVPHPAGHDIPLAVGVCSDTIAEVTVNNQTSATAVLLLNARSECASVMGYSTRDGARIVSATCHTSDKSPSHQNQEWLIDSSSHQICLASTAASRRQCGPKGGCVARVDGTNVALGECGKTNTGWVVDATAKRVRVLGGKGDSSGNCLVARG